MSVEPQERGLTFMHVPKCAGTSVRRALVDAVRPTIVQEGYDQVLFGWFRDFESMPGIPVHRSARSLYPSAELAMGHFALSTLLGAYPRHRTLAVLREPATRLLSHFLFWRSMTEVQLARWGSWAQVMRLGELADVREDPILACQIDNVATRMLLWPHSLLPDDGFITPDSDDLLVRMAQDRIERLSLCLTQEDPSLFVKLGDFLGMDRVSPISENGLPPAILPHWKVDELTVSSTREALRARTRLDARLWEGLGVRCDAADVLARAIARYRDIGPIVQS